MQRTIYSAADGSKIPVTTNLKVIPLTRSTFINGKYVKNHPVVNGNGRVIMNDEWIYVHEPGYGNISINVNRANFARKQYLMNTKITDSIDNDKITPRLKAFIENVADTLVFQHNNIAYRVELTKTKEGFDLLYVYPFWAMNCTGGIMPTWFSNQKKYGLKAARGGWLVDLNETFGFNF